MATVTAWTLSAGLPLWTDSIAQEPSNAELARRIELLAEELDDLKLGEVATGLESKYGFAPAASKVYGVQAGLSFGGYGEMIYNRFSDEREDGEPSNKSDQLDFLRQILYVGFKFDERVVLNTEIEVEHASTGKGGEVSLEFAYLDFLIDPAFNARAGLLLVPMGFVNELHEPPIFFGVHRPEIEAQIIPSTWRANGLGIFGEPKDAIAGLSYRAYLIESLASVRNTSRSEQFRASGLRNGRQKGSRAVVEDLAGVLRIDYERNGVLVGGSIFMGNTAQNDTTPSGDAFDALTTIYEAHVQMKYRGLSVRGLLASANVDDAEKINAANGFTGSASVGSTLLGWYVEAGYDVLTELAPESRYGLVPYVRYSQLDTQNEIPEGFSADPANDRSILTAGLAFYPHAQVVIKTDYEHNSNKAETGTDQWNFGLGYLF